MPTSSRRAMKRVGQGNIAAALVSYRQALAINDNDPALWLKLARRSVERADAEKQLGNGTYDLGATATYAALFALLQSEHGPGARRCAGLAGAGARAPRDVARGHRDLSRFHRAGRQCRSSARLDKAVAEHGFRITSNEVDAEGATPRICVVFSDPLPPATTDLSSYITVEGTSNVAVETESSQICLTGVEHGKRYHVKVRAGLPSANNETLRKDVELDVYVPDRTPFVGFANNAYVMPSSLGGGLPITSVNAEKADVIIYRIGDRSIATAIRNGVFRPRPRRLFGRGRRLSLWREGLGRRSRSRQGRAQRDDHHRHSGERRSGRHRARRLCRSRPRSPAATRNIGARWRRSGSSSPISASPRCRAMTASMSSCARSRVRSPSPARMCGWLR